MISRREFLSASSMAGASLGLGLAGARNAKAAWLAGLMQSGRGVSATQDAETIVLHSSRLAVMYDRKTGKMEIHWQNGHALAGIVSGAELADGRRILTSDYAEHVLEAGKDAEETKGARKFTVVSRKAGMPEIRQHVWLHEGKPGLWVQVELDEAASMIGTRHFDVLLAEGADAVRMGEDAKLRMLKVPFDNDMWVRYASVPVAEMVTGQKYSSSAVTAFYDDATRKAIVAGAITHDVWKTAIDVKGTDGALLGLDVYGGISSPTGVRTDTHDTVPHGLVRGRRVLSPRVFVGSFADWRDGMEAYGRANAEMHPPLIWVAGAPMGWNSWAAYANKINYSRYLGAAKFMRDVLVPEGFGRDHVVYINYDAFWSLLNGVQLADTVDIIKQLPEQDGMRFKPGIYWAPFASFFDDLDAFVEGTDMKYRYRDILLKAPNGELMPKMDGGRPVDPTHPGAKARISEYMRNFRRMGFEYLKIDFLSHGALEGAHYDAAVRTGIEAYNAGMRQIVEENGGQMFLSLSIAPVFPAGYGHSRRISCDTKGQISGKDQSTEYMLNSLTYGWWTSGNLYIADPDHVVLGVKADHGARNITEGRSRLMSAIISGGMILDSSRLADDVQGQDFARAVYGNRKLLAVASEQKAFRPVEGNTGDKAATAFLRPSARGYYLAVFNYEFEKAQTVSVPLRRIARRLAAGKVKVRDVATGEEMSAANGAVTVTLAGAESRLLELMV
ncbi:MAG: twin-arginine translocation signal domain-containing protein [Acidobacteriaceae bacterium]